MAGAPEILFLAHRIPYPPDRGDKMRSWHVLRHLGSLARVHLAAFTETEADAAQLAPMRAAMGGRLGEVHIEPRGNDALKFALRALWRREPLSSAAFHSGAMASFAERILATRPIGAVYAFSQQMAQYVPADADVNFVMDFVDVDSAKFADYAEKDRWLNWLIYKHEAFRVRALENATARRARLSLFVSDAEADLFRDRGAPAEADIRALPNGIDLDFYDPDAEVAALDPAPPSPLIVFTGQMAYRPNAEAVVAFAETELPLIRRVRPDVHFAIVGREPTPAVAQLARRPGVIVTGEVADVRPWLKAASVVVAPLAIARGVQNKVLEAMAMGRPVVASPDAFLGIDAEPDRDLIVAGTPVGRAEAVLALLADPARAAAIGRAARLRMETGYSWDAQLAPLAAMTGLAA